MHPDTVSIISITSVSALGRDSSEVWRAYNNRDHALTDMGSDTRPEYVGKLQEETMQAILAVRNSEPAYKGLDDSVLYGMHAARAAVRKAGWGPDVAFGVNLGSSRGATRLFEGCYKEFLETGATSTQASPTTTLGNIASWVAQDLRSKGPDLSHSITCSTALHAVMNGVAWLKAGLVEKFLAGGSEAPLTDFTIAQMRALKIYSRESGAYPCRALDLAKTNNSMVLGEGAAVVCMEMGARENAVAWIEGIGYATEPLHHGASLSSNASCLQDSMKMALGDILPGEIDILVLHAPGTLKGDRAEYRAVQKVFGTELPAMTTNKWKAGHTLGASGTLSLEMAVMMLQHQRFVGVPYIENAQQPRRFRYAMVNAVGFGANAVSIVLRSPVEK